MHGNQAWLEPHEQTTPNSAAPISQLKAALVLNSGSAYRWADLGEAYASAHETQKATYSFERAVERAPNNPTILLRAANTYFYLGNYSATRRCLAIIRRRPELGEYYPLVDLTERRMPPNPVR